MKLRETIDKAHDALLGGGVDHALIGGIALATLGLNRATADVDLLIDGEQKDKAIMVLEQNGFKLKTSTKEVLHFEGFGYLDILLANRPISKEMLKNADLKANVGLKCVKAEDIIGLKIQAYVNDRNRELQDKADIKALFDLLPFALFTGPAESYALWSKYESVVPPHTAPTIAAGTNDTEKI